MQRLQRFSFSLLLLLGIIRCAGGTIGSDSGGPVKITQLSGKIVDPQGQPLSSVSVRANASDDTTTTNAVGEFQLAAPIINGEVNLEIEDNGQSAPVDITGFEEADASAVVTLEFDTQAGVVQVLSISITPLEVEPTPAAAPTARPTRAPQQGGASPSPTTTPQAQESVLAVHLVDIAGRIAFPARGAQLTVIEGQSTGVTDQNGRVRLNFPSGSSEINLRISYSNIETGTHVVTTIQIEGLPTYRALVSVELKISRVTPKSGKPSSGRSVVNKSRQVVLPL